MSEAANHYPEAPKQPELSIVAPLELAPHQDFDPRVFLELIDQNRLHSSVGILIKLLEQLSLLPSDLDQVEADITLRQQLIEKIANAKELFDKKYTDPASSIGINKKSLSDLFDKTELYDTNPELLALAKLAEQARPDVVVKRADGSIILEDYKPLINEAEYVYRLVLLPTDDIIDSSR